MDFEKPSAYPFSRREFLKGLGIISIGFPLLGCSIESSEKQTADDLPSSLNRHPQVNAWLEIMEDGTIQILTGKIELGQGIATAILQVAAEELNTHPDQLRINLAETGRTPNEGYTAGSRSIESSAMSVRYAAATARSILLQLASKKFDVELNQLTLENATLKVKNADQEISFYEILNGEQIYEEVTYPVDLKPKTQYSWVGTPVKNIAIESMIDGSYAFVQDLTFDGMEYGQVIRPKGYGSKLAEFDANRIEQLPGVIKVVRNGSFLGIIGKSTFEVIKAKSEAQKTIKWTASDPLPQSDQLKAYLLSLSTDDQQVTKKGSRVADNSHQATYFKPYVMHGATGPSCAVAIFENDQLHIWTHSQGVYPLRESLSNMLQMSEENIHIKGVVGSGCYGHNGADDVAADVALLAINYPGKHIQLQWLREDEHLWEPYGSAMIMKLGAKLDQSGSISHWDYELWSDSHSTRPGGDPASLLAARYLETPFEMQSSGYRGGAYRNAEPFYDLPNLHINAHFFKGPLRVSALRSLGAYANIFAIESFLEELAYQTNQDPLEFRLKHQTDQRAIDILKKLGSLTSIIELKDREGIGYGFSRYKNSASYCGVAAQIAVDDQSNVQIKKMWAVVDAGEIINPDGLKNQVEGGMAQAASWTLVEEIQFNENGITSKDWTSYPLVGISQFNNLEVHLIDRPSEKPLGAGETAQGPTAAAICNAIFAATSIRVRELPVSAHGFKIQT